MGVTSNSFGVQSILFDRDHCKMILFNLRLVFILSALLTSFAANPTQIVDLGYAKYQATLNTASDITNFLGIRFAAHPIGALNFP